MKDIKTKEVTTKPKTKNPASRIPKELMRTAILESKEKSLTIANARDNDMGERHCFFTHQLISVTLYGYCSFEALGYISSQVYSAMKGKNIYPVSYTHLDVYKRQQRKCPYRWH